MTLSTAQPMLNAAPPELHALAVAVVPRAPMPGLPVSRLATNLGQSGGSRLPAIGAGCAKAAGAGGMPGWADLAPRGSAQCRPAVRRRPSASRLALVQTPTASHDDGASWTRRPRTCAARPRRRSTCATRRTPTNWPTTPRSWSRPATSCDRGPARRPGEVHSRRRRPGNEGPSVTYHLPPKLTVPSRNDEQVIEVARLDMEPDYFYKAVPVLTPHVYRLADLTNKSKYVLLPGEATMYQRHRLRRPDGPAAGGHRRAVHGRLRRRSAAAGAAADDGEVAGRCRAATRC